MRRERGCDVGFVVWCEGDSGGVAHLMGTKAANELGIYDMSMNVWNPTGPRSGSGWVVRGGSCSIDGGSAGLPAASGASRGCVGDMPETRHSPPLRKSSTELTLMPERPARTLSA